MLAPSQKLMDRFPLDPNKLCKESVLILVSFALSQQAAKKIQIWLLFWKEMAFQDLSEFFFFKYKTKLFFSEQCYSIKHPGALHNGAAQFNVHLQSLCQ